MSISAIRHSLRTRAQVDSIGTSAAMGNVVHLRVRTFIKRRTCPARDSLDRRRRPWNSGQELRGTLRIMFEKMSA